MCLVCPWVQQQKAIPSFPTTEMAESISCWVHEPMETSSRSLNPATGHWIQQKKVVPAFVYESKTQYEHSSDQRAVQCSVAGTSNRKWLESGLASCPDTVAGSNNLNYN